MKALLVCSALATVTWVAVLGGMGVALEALGWSLLVLGVLWLMFDGKVSTP
jgi:hypothetical protein